MSAHVEILETLGLSSGWRQFRANEGENPDVNVRVMYSVSRDVIAGKKPYVLEKKKSGEESSAKTERTTFGRTVRDRTNDPSTLLLRSGRRVLTGRFDPLQIQYTLARLHGPALARLPKVLHDLRVVLSSCFFFYPFFSNLFFTPSLCGVQPQRLADNRKYLSDFGAHVWCFTGTLLYVTGHFVFGNIASHRPVMVRLG